MMKSVKRLSRQTNYRIVKFLRNLTSNDRPILEDTEKKCASVCRKLINHPKSKFLIAPLSMKRYIKNDELELFVVLQDRRISITNHVYHYDVVINNRSWERITNMYDNKTEKIRQEFENEMSSQIKHSLSTILSKLG